MTLLLEWVSHLGLCPIRNLTGLPCPGCGMTRALLALAKLEFRSALAYHPLFWLVPIICFVFLFRKRVTLFERLSKSKALIWSVITVFLVTYGWRMLVLFPTTVPLDFNSNGLIPLLIKRLLN